jgi:hypothetical protein
MRAVSQWERGDIFPAGRENSVLPQRNLEKSAMHSSGIFPVMLCGLYLCRSDRGKSTPLC